MKNKDVLIKLINLPKAKAIHKKFDFTKYNDRSTQADASIPYCGTAGCLAGELPGITNDWLFNQDGVLTLAQHANRISFNEILCEISAYFDLPLYVVAIMFCPYFTHVENGISYHSPKKSATLKQVQSNIKKLMKSLKHYFIENHSTPC